MTILSTPIKSFKRSPLIAKGSVLLFKARLLDENDDPITSSNLEALTLTLIDLPDAVVNEVDETNILNTDRGTVDSSGNLSILLEPEDTDFSGNVSITRSMIIKWVYSGGKTGGHRVDFTIVSLGV